MTKDVILFITFENIKIRNKERNIYIMDFIYNFVPTDENGFPLTDCTAKDEVDENIYIGKEKYTCLIIDVHIKGHYEIIHNCIPYIYKENDKILYGWLDEEGNIIDNLYNSIHLDDRCVIGYTTENIPNIDEDWTTFGLIRDRQWET